jgi:hypothetical protein
MSLWLSCGCAKPTTVTVTVTVSSFLCLQGIIEAMMSNNVPPIPPDKVLGFNTRKEADLYMADHPDGCLGAVQFVRQAADTYSYIVTSNSTVRVGGWLKEWDLAVQLVLST